MSHRQCKSVTSSDQAPSTSQQASQVKRDSVPILNSSSVSHHASTTTHQKCNLHSIIGDYPIRPTRLKIAPNIHKLPMPINLYAPEDILRVRNPSPVWRFPHITYMHPPPSPRPTTSALKCRWPRPRRRVSAPC
jgi:hypothetical protein